MALSLPDHKVFMKQAIELGKTNPQAPFGAILVDRRTGVVAARGVNHASHNPTLHGEIAAINDYVAQGKSDWHELTLYTTAEPCCMCQGAILWAGIREVVFGTSIAQLKKFGWKQIDIPSEEVVARSWSPGLALLGGVCADECDRLFRETLAR